MIKIGSRARVINPSRSDFMRTGIIEEIKRSSELVDIIYVEFSDKTVSMFSIDEIELIMFTCEAQVAQFISHAELCGETATHVISFDTNNVDATFLTCEKHSKISVPARTVIYALPVDKEAKPSVYEDSAVRDAIWNELQND